MPCVKLPCIHGWHVRCRACRRLAAALDAEFHRRVFFGEYNARGYTPAEWTATHTKDRPCPTNT